MTIDRSNYEQFFLDYFEGSLPEGRMDELRAFLEANPDLKAEFEQFESITLPMDALSTFPNKELLKKNKKEPTGAFEPNDEILVAYMEGDLDDDVCRQIEEHAAHNPRAKRDLDLMLATRLITDKQIVYPRRSGLKRHHIVFLRQRIVSAISAVAAVLLLAALVYTFYQVGDQTRLATEQPVAGEGGSTEAVAEIPVPPQDQMPASGMLENIAHAALQPALVPDLLVVGMPGLDARRQRLVQPDSPTSLASLRPGSLQRAQQDFPVDLEPRMEYQWLAYRTADTFEQETDTERVAQAHQVSLAQLAMIKLGVASEADASAISGLVFEEGMPGILHVAGRTLLGLNELAGRPIQYEERAQDSGRRTQFAIGNFFEVSRHSAD